MARDARAIVLFDGVCNLCNDAVRFLVPRDPEGRLAFAPLQSAAGRRLQQRFGLDPDDLDTLVLVEGDRCFVRSTAALRAARQLRGAWPLLYVGILVPRAVRDRAYAAVARRRYLWFGRRDACPAPDPALRDRFL